MRFIVEMDDEGLEDVDQEELGRLIQDAVLGTHALGDGDLYIGNARVTADESHLAVVPRRSFKAWLQQQLQRNDPVGDLARDAGDDKNAPSGRKSFLAWRSYLQSRWAHRDVMRTLKEAWGEFEKGGATPNKGVQ